MSEIGISGTLFETILQVFFSFCKELPGLSPSATEKQQTRCQHELERLFLWGDGVSTHDGSLDEILLLSSALRSSVLLTLLELGSVVCNDLSTSITSFSAKYDKERDNAIQLMDRVHATLQEDVPASDSEELELLYDSESQKPNLDDVLDKISIVNDCLMDLSLALERPIIDSDEKHQETRGPAETFNVTQPALVYCRKIRDRFPNLPRYLVERLGNANLQRANMLREIRKSIQSEGEGFQFADESLFSKSIPQITDTTKSTFAQDSMFSSKGLQIMSEDEFETSSDATFASFSSSTSTTTHGRPRVPPFPEQAEGGNAFRCEYCAKVIQGLITRRQWKSHVFQDIGPYTCTVESCEIPEALFRSSRNWASHQNQHAEHDSSGLSCPFCGASISSSIGAFYRHVGRHLREVSLAVLPQTTYSESEKDSDSDESSEVAPTALPDLVKEDSRVHDFMPTDILHHRYQDPSVLISYLKALPDKFSDDQITVKILNDGSLGLRLPRRLETRERDGVLQAFETAELNRRGDDTD